VKHIQDNLGYLIVQICKGHRYCAEKLLNEQGVHAGQEMILFQLWEQDGLSQSQLAETMCVEPPTISKMIQRMEGVGLVERRPDAEDARVSRVYLTPQSQELERGVEQAWQKLEAQTVDGLTETEQLLLRRLLMQVLANLSR
jgi:MarR family transcriptional regulator, organic hydroperoxide resistance regulator